MNILVLATDYPDDLGKIALMYVHARNKFYVEKGHKVTVLNFAANRDYVVDGINVFSLKTFEQKLAVNNFDILLLHSPNIRNHYRFIQKHDIDIPMVFFFHGHEILKIKEYYPEPYAFMKKKNIVRNIIQNPYDDFKIKKWERFFKTSTKKYDLVFVSLYLQDLFLRNLQIDQANFKHRMHIIPNSIGRVWEENRYLFNKPKQYDFITIRNKIDLSVYSVDLLCKWASNNPQKSFLLIGQGEYFDHNKLPENLVHINKALPHEKLMEYVNESRAALMPTRHDTQGVMSCELASFGIPLITSDIPICREVFKDFPNVEYINNSSDGTELQSLLDDLSSNYEVKSNDTYYLENTSRHELEVFTHAIENYKQ